MHIPSLAEFTCNVNKSNNIYHHQLQPNHYHLPPYPSSTTTTSTLPPNYYHPPEEDNNLLLKQVIEQCTAIHQEIARYRVDALTEADRNQIVDLVYYTTDSMMKSLKTLDEQLYPTNELDYSYPSTPSSSQSRPFHEDTNSSKYEMIRQARNLQDNNLRPKYRRRNKRSMIGQRCHSCNTTETPEWRRGPDGARTLCNACGLHYSKLLRKGSLTVQTHNYLLDTPSEKKMPRIIQFPIIEVQANKDTMNHEKMMTTSDPKSSNNINNNNNNSSSSSSSQMNNNRRLIDLIHDHQKEPQ
ncbi:hypothetical protein G6F43_011049 [Rhizopus delemar]|nr:hypothetical protein G6F43_011049 [Rhizopus delemar]